MRVLHVIPSVAPRYGGPSRAIFEMCRALQEKGVDQMVATTDADGGGRLPVDLAKTLDYDGVPTIFFSRQWSEAFKYSRPLARWLESEVSEFDVVHVHAVFSHSSLAASRACRRHGVPYVVRPLGSLDPWSLSQKRLRKRLLWHLGVKQMLQGCSAIHYTTAAERCLTERALSLTNGTVVPLGVDAELLNEPKTSEIFRARHPTIGQSPYVLVLCRLHPKKRLELFLDVFLEVTRKSEFEHWRLVVAGVGLTGYVARLQRLLRERDDDGRVLMTGWLEGVERTAALREAALLALPSRQENFGLSVAEAMACGVPVLISPHVNLAEEIDAAGAGWVVASERGPLLRVLEEVLRNEGERVSRGRSGRALVQSRFTWTAVAEELAKLYHSVTGMNGRE